MNIKKLILLAGALIIALVTAFMAKSMLAKDEPVVVGKPAKAAVVPDSGPQILVATRNLPIGTIITPENFRYQPWPKELVETAYFLKANDGSGELPGTVVRTAISAGQPLTRGSLIKPGERGFLAAALGPGMRAVTVPVNPQSAVSGFMFPGDRVDMVLIQSISGGDGPALKTSETIIRNMRVLATDQRTSSLDEAGKPEVKAFTNVTLEVTPRMAEKIAVAQTLGQLSLSLRALAENGAELEQAIASGNVKVPANGDAKAEQTMMLSIQARPTDTATSFVTGADVSKFQRRSIPLVAKPEVVGQKINAATGDTVGREKAQGPVVKIARGNTETSVSFGGK